MGLRSEDQRRGVCTLSRAGSNVTVRSNSTYTIYLRANGLSYIPAGDVYLHLEYFDDVSSDVPVKPCQYHRSHHLSCMRSISADIQSAVIQGHAGLKWSIPGSNAREYSSYISFTWRVVKRDTRNGCFAARIQMDSTVVSFYQTSVHLKSKVLFATLTS